MNISAKFKEFLEEADRQSLDQRLALERANREIEKLRAANITLIAEARDADRKDEARIKKIADLQALVNTQAREIDRLQEKIANQRTELQRRANEAEQQAQTIARQRVELVRLHDELRSLTYRPSPADSNNIPHTHEKMVEYLARSGFSLYRAAAERLVELDTFMGHQAREIEGLIAVRDALATKLAGRPEPRIVQMPDKYKFFGYWDCFNGCLIREADVAQSVRGGNGVKPLYERT